MLGSIRFCSILTISQFSCDSEKKTRIISTLPPVHIPYFIKLALIVFERSWDPDFSGQTDGKLIVPTGVNTSRGLINKKTL